ncbi:hypothetical protein D3C71_1232780 [compost metagenome]
MPGTLAVMCVKIRSSHPNSATSRYKAARSVRTCHSVALTCSRTLAPTLLPCLLTVSIPSPVFIVSLRGDVATGPLNTVLVLNRFGIGAEASSSV